MRKKNNDSANPPNGSCIVSSPRNSPVLKLGTDKGRLNRVICIAIHVLQMVSVGIAALIIMVAGLKYMTSEDVDARSDSKSMIIRSRHPDNHKQSPLRWSIIWYPGAAYRLLTLIHVMTFSQLRHNIRRQRPQ